MIKKGNKVKVMSEGTYKGRIGRVIQIKKTEDKRGALLTLKLRRKEELLIYEKEVKVLSIFKKRDKVRIVSKDDLYDGMIGEVIDKHKVESGFRYDVELNNKTADYQIIECDEDELEKVI